MDVTGKPRHLVVHDYGMGAVWWWVRAESAQAVLDAVAEVEVSTRPAALEWAATADLEEIDLDDPGPHSLTSFLEKRAAQRAHPAFPALAGRERVYLRDDEDEGWEILMELGPDGRTVRQVVVEPGAAPRAETEEDWPFNAPFDLYDPALLPKEITAEDFEAAWRAAGGQAGRTLP
ncbi:hypothetical protein [Streptomyces tritici]|uniref:hypothetical protein n=1 Tax=Streptomyces tritici TaxID=2054410 RepID=UPI003AEF9952